MSTVISGDTGIDKATWSSQINGFRLSLSTGTPVTTADVTGATTIYCTPYKGESIALYDGSLWQVRQSAEFSLALGTLTSGKPYDVFCYDNAGTPTLEFLVWTNDTTRATALAYQDGVLVKSGAATRRYLGTFYTTATTTTEDSVANRYLWNYYHRVNRALKRVETTASWTYTTATLRQANGSTLNQLNFIQGVAEDIVTANVSAFAYNSGGTPNANVGIGVDSTAVNSADISHYAVMTTTVKPLAATYSGISGDGRHYLAWLEYSQAAGTTTWEGGSPGFSGIVGEVMA